LNLPLDFDNLSTSQREEQLQEWVSIFYLIHEDNDFTNYELVGCATTQFIGILIFLMEKMPLVENDKSKHIAPIGQHPLCKAQIIDIDSLKKTIVDAFRLYKEISKDSYLRMLMGMELVNLKRFNEFMADYEKLEYMSGHGKYKVINKILIAIMPHPIPKKVHVMMQNKNCEIAKQTLANVAEMIRICIEEFCMD